MPRIPDLPEYLPGFNDGKGAFLNVMSVQLFSVRKFGWCPCPAVHPSPRGHSERVFGTCRRFVWVASFS